MLWCHPENSQGDNQVISARVLLHLFPLQKHAALSVLIMLVLASVLL